VAAPRTLGDELAEILAERGSREVEGGGALRWRNGEGGLSQLVELSAPVTLQLPLGDAGRLQLRVTPTLVDAGSAPQDADGASRLGSQALSGTRSTASVSAAGVGLKLGLAGRSWSADVGTTPLGFRVINAVGGVSVGGEFTPQMGFNLEFMRRAMTDSVLSYSGLRDPVSGEVWGGVVATGLRGSLQWKDSDFKLGSYLGAQSVQGKNVQGNTHVELGGSATWTVTDEPTQRIEAGTQINYQHYERNLRHFTLGHGGYFSPQHQITLSAPMKVVGRDGRFAWSLAAAPGLNAWREDSAPYFPDDAAAQAQLQSRVALGQAATATYGSRSSFGFSLGLQGATEYRLSPRMLFGTRLALDSASQYTQLSAGLYLRLRLDADAPAPRGLLEPASLAD
jgi:hypothetical protein